MKHRILIALFLPALLAATASGCADRVQSILALQGDSAKGQARYNDNCSTCHGFDGNGVLNVSLAVHLPAHTDSELADLILNGGATMPGFADTLTDSEIADLMAYLRVRFP